MTILLSRELQVECDWQTFYTTTYSGRSQLDLRMADGEIVSITDTALDDVTLIHNYTDQQKKVIRMVLADERVATLFGEDQVEPTGVRDFGVSFNGCEGKCAIAHFHVKDNLELGAAMHVDITNERVLSVRPSLKLISAQPERALSIVSEGEYLINVSFSEPMNKHNFARIEREHGLKINNVEYAATLNVTGTSEYSSLAKLEHDLAFRHGAELVGITKFAARAETNDWLDFYRQLRNSISDFDAVQVIR